MGYGFNVMPSCKITDLFSGQCQNIGNNVLGQEVVGVSAVEVVIVNVIAAGQQMTARDGHGLDGLRQVRSEVQEQLPFFGVSADVTPNGHKDLVFDGA